MATYPPLEERPLKTTICLFDVDETLTPARRHATPEMLDLLARLRQKCAIGYVGGSAFNNTWAAPTSTSNPGHHPLRLLLLRERPDCLQAYIGEDNYKELVRFTLHHIADLDIPVKRGTFIEFRNGMVNISPVGRNASNDERKAFEDYDKIHNVRRDFVAKLREKFGHLGLTFSIGGTEAKKEGGITYDTIHFFGDKTHEGGNDYEIYTDDRTIGHAVSGPEETMRIVKELFDL
uniref:Phosphomannomutase n=1 Tax=Colletotrichum fructicola (strain Nara gc5) TaxID=1213859 RepID=L2G9D6_COLFN